MENKTCLSYWYPRVCTLPGILTPRTLVFTKDCKSGMPVNALFKEFGGETISKEEEKDITHFINALATAGHEVGYPCFLRTGLTSGKHEWVKTCHVERAGAMSSHVYRLVDTSLCVDLSFNVWAVRELLPTQPAFHAFAGMPICQEYRCFGKDGKFLCIHPYWPEDSIRDPAPARGWKKKLKEMSEIQWPTKGLLSHKTEQVTKALGGYWSVDWLWVPGKGWYLTDMAEGEVSFHWRGCPHGDK